MIKIISACRATLYDAKVQYDRPPSRASDAARAHAVQVRQAAQQRERRSKGRRAVGALGVAPGPAAVRGACCHRGYLIHLFLEICHFFLDILHIFTGIFLRLLRSECSFSVEGTFLS